MKVVEDEGKNGQRRTQRHCKAVAKQAPCTTQCASICARGSAVLGGLPCREGAAQAGGHKHKPCGGRGAHLKAHIPKDVRRERSHHQAGGSEAHQRRTLAAQRCGYHHQHAHECGAQHSGLRAHQQRVDGNARQRRHPRGALAQKPCAQRQQHTGDQSHVTTGNDDHVRRARVIEALAHIVGDVGLDAQQHAVGERSIGLSKGAVDEQLAPCAHGI